MPALTTLDYLSYKKSNTMFLLSLCIRIQINSTARIQYLKKKEKKKNERIVYVWTKDVSEIRQKKKKKKNRTIWHIQKKKEFQNLFFR